VLRRIFGPRRDEVTRGCRKLHNEELNNLYSSPSIIRMIKSRRILVGKSKGNRPLGKPRCRWVDNIKMDLREIGWYGMDWFELAQG
jgi:hypothetical protein